MKKLYLIAFCLAILMALTGCSKKQPVGTFKAVECNMVCSQTTCTQQCIGASGDYYKK